MGFNRAAFWWDFGDDLGGPPREGMRCLRSFLRLLEPKTCARTGSGPSSKAKKPGQHGWLQRPIAARPQHTHPHHTPEPGWGAWCTHQPGKFSQGPQGCGSVAARWSLISQATVAAAAAAAAAVAAAGGGAGGAAGVPCRCLATWSPARGVLRRRRARQRRAVAPCDNRGRGCVARRIGHAPRPRASSCSAAPAPRRSPSCRRSTPRCCRRRATAPSTCLAAHNPDATGASAPVPVVCPAAHLGRVAGAHPAPEPLG